MASLPQVQFYLPSAEHVRRAVLRVRLEEFVNECQHAPYPEGRFCDNDGGAVGSAGWFKERYPNISEGQAAYLEYSYGGSHKESKRGKFLVGVETAQEALSKMPEGQRADYFPDGKPIPGSAEWREAHGISSEVYADRPYYRFPKGGDFTDLPQEVQDMYNDPDPVMQGAKRQLLKIMAQDGGIIMSRSTVPGTAMSDTPIPPQVRPDQAIINDMRDLRKREGQVRRAEVAAAEAEAHTPESVVLKQEGRVERAAAAIETAKTMTKEKYMAPLEEAASTAESELETIKESRKEARRAAGRGNDPGYDETMDDDALNKAQTAHNIAKSNLSRGAANAAREFKFGDEAYQERAGKIAEQQKAWAEAKLERYKADPAGAIANEKETTADFLEHAKDQLDAVPAKYLFPPVPEALKGDVAAGKVLSSSARVEAHGAENLRRLTETKGPVYLAMEGNLKSDAVQSAIFREGDPEASVISVPSVTLWRHKEMMAVALAHLQGREVILIPDADGETNVNVRNEARALQAMLINAGVTNVKIAAPPMDDVLTPTGKQKVEDGMPVRKPKEFVLPSGIGEKAKGADDWLATNSELKGTLGGMTAQRRVLPEIKTLGELSTADQTAFIEGRYKGSTVVVDVPTQAGKNSKKALVGVMTLLGESGVGVVNVSRLSATMGHFYDNGKQASNALGYLETAGLIRRENIYDPDELLRGNRVQVMSDSRINELVRAGAIQRPDFDRPADVGTRESPVITVLSDRVAKDLPRVPLEKSGRQVATPEGAAFYGVSIGTTITPEIIARAAKKRKV